MKISIVVPAWNEAERIAPTLRGIAAELRGEEWELIVVDDGSTDATVAVCRSLGIPELRVIESKPNRGKGHAVRIGMRAAIGEVRVMCDADGSMPATELRKLVSAVLDGGSGIAIGSRYIGGADAGGQPLWRRIWSRVSHALTEGRLVPGVRDIHSGYKVFRGDIASELFADATLDGWVFDLEVLALARRRGVTIREVPIRWRDDRGSKVNPLRDLQRAIEETSQLERRLRAR